MATRTQLLADPRSGARPLSGSPGPADVEDEGQAAVEDTEGAGTEPPAFPPEVKEPVGEQGRSASRRLPDEVEPLPSRDASPAPPGAEEETEDETPAPAPARPARQRRAGHALGGVVVGLFGWAFAMNWIRGGKAQAFGWVAAKFINVPYTAGEVPGGTGFPTPSGNLPAPQQITQQVPPTT